LDTKKTKSQIEKGERNGQPGKNGRRAFYDAHPGAKRRYA
jgi:hypothetical protein